MPEWRLAIAGGGPERDRLTGLIERLDLTGRIALVGEVEDPFTWYARAGVFVLASRYEGSPNALLEAMSYACPAIVSDAIPDHERFAQHGTAARIVPVDDVAALAAAMAGLANNSGLRVRLGRAAVEQVKSQNIKSVAPLWEQMVWKNVPVDARN